jgi:septin family protein
MKSAYELAMERLNKTSPSVKLTADQKRQIAELDSKYKAKIAEREIALQEEIATAGGTGDLAKTEELQQQLANERKKLQAELEEKKKAIRQAKR